MKTGLVSLLPGEWGERSRKIPVLREIDGAAVLDQPTPPFPAQGTSEFLAAVLSARLQTDAPRSLRRLFPNPPRPVFDLECGGPTVMATGRETSSRLREEYGSDAWTLIFHVLSRGSRNKSPIRCDLPIAKHRNADRSLISHRTGKKARTHFRPLVSAGELELWEATTRFLRPDQIRLHAMESGIRIAGESVYGDVPPLNRSDFPGVRRPGGSSHVLFPGPAIHLVSLEAPALGSEPIVSIPPKPIAKWIDRNTSRK